MEILEKMTNPPITLNGRTDGVLISGSEPLCLQYNISYAICQAKTGKIWEESND